jgi:acyl-CoA synthetase (AMP-forming)/AMP-acid ligase II/3-hydroxymyristoyl/3-hydroxydecanoyl-(acyl carrier protein) dehydratase
MAMLLRHTSVDAPLLLGPEGAISVGCFLAQARELAAQFPDTRHVVNLCESRHGFMLGFAAALMRGFTSLLPPGQGQADLELVLKRHEDACVLTDRFDDVAFPGARVVDVAPFLARRSRIADEIPDIDVSLEAAILFTSGSTGQPAAHAKTWEQLCRGAHALSAALGWTGERPEAIVGSVPSQHMYGLETTVMLPWQLGLAVHHRKPLLPADLEQALDNCARPCWWMTTPVHLRAPLQQPVALPQLQGVLASTMSLPLALAAEAESAWGVRVMEIYGSTETGALAARRTAREVEWITLPGVALAREADGAIWASGPHVGPPVRLADELQLESDGRFRWLGRAGDLIKVGGKRASLAALNQQLAELPGVDDAAYFLPPDEHAPGAQRLAAFYVSGRIEPRELMRSLRERVDPVFLPRPLFRVTSLPRNANGKLTQAALSTLLAQCRALEKRSADRISAEAIASSGNGQASFVIPSTHPALPDHFPGNPIVPGAVILAHVADGLRALYPALSLTHLLNARFHEPLMPGIECVIQPRLAGDGLRFEVRAKALGSLIASGQWRIADGAAA